MQSKAIHDNFKADHGFDPLELIVSDWMSDEESCKSDFEGNEQEWKAMLAKKGNVDMTTMAKAGIKLLEIRQLVWQSKQVSLRQANLYENDSSWL
jgi:hypothetical protein